MTIVSQVDVDGKLQHIQVVIVKISKRWITYLILYCSVVSFVSSEKRRKHLRKG